MLNENENIYRYKYNKYQTMCDQSTLVSDERQTSVCIGLILSITMHKQETGTLFVDSEMTHGTIP